MNSNVRRKRKQTIVQLKFGNVQMDLAYDMGGIQKILNECYIAQTGKNHTFPNRSSKRGLIVEILVHSTEYMNDQANQIDYDGYMSRFFKEVGTQVEESDIAPDAVRTGVADSPHVVSYAQVFGTASLNSEPQITFVLPSMKSAFGQGTTLTGETPTCDDNTVMTSKATLNATVSTNCSPTLNKEFPKDTVSSNPHTSRHGSTSSTSSGPLCPKSASSHSKTGPKIFVASDNSSNISFSSRPLSQASGPVRVSNDLSATGSSRAVVYTTARSSAAPKITESTMNNLVSGVSGQNPQPRLANYPHIYLPLSFSQSGFPVPRDTSTTLDRSSRNHSETSTSNVPGSPLQTSKRFILNAPRDARHASSSHMPPCNLPHDMTSSSVSMSPGSEKCTAPEQHSLQLTGQEHDSASCSRENPLTRRRASSAPSVGLEFFGRIFKRALLTNNCPEQVDVGLPPKRDTERRLETSSNATQAQCSAREQDTEPVPQCAGSKRRRSSLGSGKERKRRRSVAFVDNENDGDSRLRDTLHQRIWDGTSFKVEEVRDIDFDEMALSRRGSRRESMGILGNSGNVNFCNRRRNSVSVSSVRVSHPGGSSNSQRRRASRNLTSTPQPRHEPRKRKVGSAEETGETSHQAFLLSHGERTAESPAGHASHAQNQALNSIQSKNGSSSTDERTSNGKDNE